MRRALPLSLAALILCGFGAGPFWGENKGPASGGGFALSNFGSGSDGTDGELSATLSYDAGTGSGRGLIVAICALHTEANAPILSTTPLTYNGVAMTNLEHATNWNNGRPVIAVYYLNNPAAGTNDIAITFEPVGTGVNAWSIVAARLSGHAATQNGPTDGGTWGGTAITSDLSGNDPADLVGHFACVRGGDPSRVPVSTDNITIQHSESSGTSTTSDVQLFVASEINPPLQNTYSGPGGMPFSYWVDASVAILPE